VHATCLSESSPHPYNANLEKQANAVVMKITARTLLSCLLLLASMTAAPALTNHVAREQDIIGLRLGQRVMVDDGTCPQGQIKEVYGAKMTASGVEMARRCVPRSGPKTK
jgi:Family of unknown function (DUF6719)